MLNIAFERNSAPITDAELLSVMDAIRPIFIQSVADGRAHSDMDLALLLARMVFRIDVLKGKAAAATQAPTGYVPVPIKPTSALLVPFINCMEDELERAWSIMVSVAANQFAERNCT